MDGEAFSPFLQFGRGQSVDGCGVCLLTGAPLPLLLPTWGPSQHGPLDPQLPQEHPLRSSWGLHHT